MNMNEELREKIYWFSLWGALALALMAALLSYLYRAYGPLEFSYSDFFGINFWWEFRDNHLLPVFCGVVLLQCLLLRFSRRLTTHSSRLLGLIVYLGFPISWFCYLGDRDFGYFGLLCLLTFLLWYPGLVAYSIPSSFVGLFPLLLHYFFLLLILLSVRDGRIALVPSILFLAYFPMAGYCFPKHRRLREFWKPARLPRIRRRRRGVTLIELLIVVAIIAIMATLLVNLHGNTRRLLERQTDWRAAVALAEEEFDLLRARGDLPAPGRYPVDPALFGHFPFAEQAEVEVRPGPAERLREVQVHVRLRGDANDHDITLAAILPIPAGRREARP